MINGHESLDPTDQLKTALLVSTPPLIQSAVPKSRTSFAPILPKPPQLQQSALYHQMFQMNNRRRSGEPIGG